MASSRKDLLLSFNSKLQEGCKEYNLWIGQDEITLYGPYPPRDGRNRGRGKVIDLDNTDPIPTFSEITLNACDSHVPPSKILEGIHRVFPNVRIARFEFPLDDFSFLQAWESLYYLRVASSKQSHLKGIEFVHQLTHLSLADGDEDDEPPRTDAWNLSNLNGCGLQILAIDANRPCRFEDESLELPSLRELILKETCYRACKIIDIPESCEIAMKYKGDRISEISNAIIRWKPNNEIFSSIGFRW